MSDEIKYGNRVIVYKPEPCCGSDVSLGIIGIAGPPPWFADSITCDHCGHVTIGTKDTFDVNGHAYMRQVLKKLPDLGEDESADTRADLDKPVKEVV